MTKDIVHFCVCPPAGTDRYDTATTTTIIHLPVVIESRVFVCEFLGIVYIYIYTHLYDHDPPTPHTR